MGTSSDNSLVTLAPPQVVEHQNYLGTERMRTMPTGPYNSSSPNYAVEATYADQPFGDNKLTIPTGADTDANHYAFLDTDKETATDHADFRQYSNAQGRWMAPDPYDGSYDPINPQSLNRYVYAMNSPLSLLDPSGLDNYAYNGTTGCWDWVYSIGESEDGTPYFASIEGAGGCGVSAGSGYDASTGASAVGGPNSLPGSGVSGGGGGGGGVGGNAPNNGTPKSPARQQCEANAQQSYQNATSAAEVTAGSAEHALEAGAIAVGTAGLVGCGKGVLVAAITGPEGWGAACVGNGLWMIGETLPEAGIASGLGGLWGGASAYYHAYQNRNAAMQACANIP
jgi:RHS repeat-associated protein